MARFKLFLRLCSFFCISGTLAMLPETLGTSSNDVKDCINQYLQPMVGLAVDFSKEMIQCNSLSAQGALPQINANRDTISQSATNICQQMHVCLAESTDSQFFNCFTSISAQVYPTIFQTVYDSQMLFDLQFGELNETKRVQALCITEAEKKYMLKNIQYVDQINNCVQSAVGIPTASPIVITTTTTVPPSTVVTESETTPNLSTTNNTQSFSTTTSNPTSLKPTSIEPTSVPNPTHLPLSTPHSVPNSANRIRTAVGSLLCNSLQNMWNF